MISFLHRKASAITGLIISLVIPTLPLSAFSAQKITAGAPCTKLNTKAVANNKTYTCIKKGSKLVWNSGVAIKSAAPAPSPSATQSQSGTQSQPTIDPLSRDSRITSASMLSPLSICKTSDNTPDYNSDGSTKIFRNGFPRPKEALYPSNKAKILVIPYTYGSWPFVSVLPKNSIRPFSDLDLLKNNNKEVEKLFKELSNGSFEVEISVLPENEWWVMNPSLTFTSEAKDNLEPILELIKDNDGKVDFEKYDSYVFVSSMQAPTPSVALAAYTTNIKTSKGKANKLVVLTSGWINPTLYFHELGHSMFGLEDLYLMYESPAEWLPGEFKVILPWDLMADSVANMTLTNWNRLLMGWLPDSEIRCLTDQTQTTHYLSYFTNRNQPKLLLINLAPGVTLAAESRFANANQGLLLYIIDTNLAHGGGPLRSINTLVKAGEYKELFDWKFSVLNTSKDGLLVEVTKTSGKKYVAPINRVQPNTGQPDGKVRLQQGNIVETGYLTAKGTFDAVNFNSYRVFVTASDEPKKILFDTGIVNSSANPLEVEITGLVCGKDFITTSQFWKERDGKGELAEVASPQLRRWQCK